MNIHKKDKLILYNVQFDRFSLFFVLGPQQNPKAAQHCSLVLYRYHIAYPSARIHESISPSFLHVDASISGYHIPNCVSVMLVTGVLSHSAPSPGRLTEQGSVSYFPWITPVLQPSKSQLENHCRQQPSTLLKR